MIYEDYEKIYPDTCLFNGIKGYADLSTDTATIAEVDFSTNNSLTGTKAYISFTASLEKDATGEITVEIVNKDLNQTVGKTVLTAEDLKNGVEAPVVFFTNVKPSLSIKGKGLNCNYTLKTTSTIAKGGLFAALRYFVG